nr:beta-propeller fold lactonase family protein [Streptomyces corallincola]
MTTPPPRGAARRTRGHLRTWLLAAVCFAALAGTAACAGTPRHEEQTFGSAPPDQPGPRTDGHPPGTPLPGMPPVADPSDVYGADRRLAAAVRDFPARVYVPDSGSDTVSVIDPASYRVVGTIRVGHRPQHVVPSWDLRTLWVGSDLGDTLTPIDPRTGRAGTPVPVPDPYNLYFTPDGRYAVVLAADDRRIVLLDAHTMKEVRSVPLDCAGAGHADFSADGRYFVVSCEGGGTLLKVDTARMEVVARRVLPHTGAMPQDVRLAPDGSRFLVADAAANGLWILDGAAFSEPSFVPTGKGAHGLHISRDSRELYVSNRAEGTVSVYDFAKHRVTRKWRLPGGASPDTGGVSADGRVLWLSGLHHSVVYAIDTRTGVQLARVKVGSAPHGLAVYPQPGRYSLGHTGILR